MNNVRFMKYETWSDLRSLQDAINHDFNRGLGEIICLDGFTYELDNSKLIVTVSYKEEENCRRKYRVIVDYYNEEIDEWLVKSNYCVPPKMIPVGPKKDVFIVIAAMSIQ